MLVKLTHVINFNNILLATFRQKKYKHNLSAEKLHKTLGHKKIIIKWW